MVFAGKSRELGACVVGCHLQVFAGKGYVHCMKFVHCHYGGNVDCVFLEGKGEIWMWKGLNPFLVCVRCGMGYSDVGMDIWGLGYRMFCLQLFVTILNSSVDGVWMGVDGHAGQVEGLRGWTCWWGSLNSQNRILHFSRF